MARGFLFILIGSGASKVILMIATFAFARVLNKEDFGAFSFVRNILNIIFCICALNYVGLVTKFVTEIRFRKESVVRLFVLFVFSIFVCIVIGGGLILLNEQILCSIVGGEPSLVGYFRIVGALLPFFMLQPLIEGYLRGLMQFKTIGYLQVITSILFVVFVLTGIYFSGVDGAVTGLLVYYIVYSIISVYVIFKKEDIKSYLPLITPVAIKIEIGVLFTMILPVFILSFIEVPINWWGQVLLTKHASLGAIGSMTVVLQIRNLLIIIPNYFFSTFTSFQASLNASGAQKQYFGRMKKIFFGSLLIGIVTTLLMILIGKPILSIYGTEYISDLGAYHIAMLSFPFMITLCILRTNMLIKEHQQMMLWASLLSSIFFIICLYVLLELGFDALSSYFWGQLLYYLVSFVIMILCWNVDIKKSYSYENSCILH